MFLTWVNIFELNNLGWNEAAPLFLLADGFYSSLFALSAVSRQHFLLFPATVKTKERAELTNSFYFSLNIHLDSIKLSCPVNCETGKVGKRPFSQAAQADFGLKEKHRNERKGTSKLASCHRALVWSHLPFSGWSVSKLWSKRDTSSSIPPFQEMSVPHCPTAITSCGPGSPKQRSASFSRAAGVQKKKYNSYL